MNKAFLFDLDGVLINDEAIWESNKQEMYSRLFGEEIHQKLGSTLGINMDGIYERAVAVGADVPKDQLTREFYAFASEIYSNAPIPSGTNELVNALLVMEYRIGIVSASPLS